MTVGIYSIIHVPTNRAYVGQSSDIEKRWKRHLKLAEIGDKRHLYCALRKYDITEFRFDILEECTTEELNEKEIYWIKELNSYESGFNLTLGGDGIRGHKFTEEAKQRISKAVSALMTPEYRKILSDKNKGTKLSQETKDKMSAARKGKKLSPEWIENIRKARLGKPLSEAHKAALRQPRKKNR